MLEEIKSLSISEESLLKDAYIKISNTKHRCLLVLTANNKLSGVLSEGDIIRALIQGAHYCSPIKEWITRDYKFLNEFNIKDAVTLFKKYGITLLPIVDKDMCVKSFISLYDLLEQIDI